MSLTSSDVAFLRDTVATRSGHFVDEGKAYLFDTRLSALADSVGVDSVAALVEKARRPNSSKLLDRITEAMTINETLFFRDMCPFDALRREIVPKLMDGRSTQKSLSIWTAACSSGQEAYSIVMTLREHFSVLDDWHIRVLATDLSSEVLERARKGEYSHFEVNRGLPAPMLIKYFDRNKSNWVAKPELRKVIEFRKVNLIEPWAIREKFDVVFLRNVLIYFPVETKASILQRMRTHIRDDGYLLLGGGESLIKIDAPFKRQNFNDYACFRPA